MLGKIWWVLVWIVGPLILLVLGVIVTITQECNFFCWSQYDFLLELVSFIWLLLALYQSFRQTQKIRRVFFTVIVALVLTFPVTFLVDALASVLVSTYAVATNSSIVILNPVVNATLIDGQPFQLEWSTRNISSNSQLAVYLKFYWTDKNGNKLYGDSPVRSAPFMVSNARQSSLVTLVPVLSTSPDVEIRDVELTLQYDNPSWSLTSKYPSSPLVRYWAQIVTSIPIQLVKRAP